MKTYDNDDKIQKKGGASPSSAPYFFPIVELKCGFTVQNLYYFYVHIFLGYGLARNIFLEIFISFCGTNLRKTLPGLTVKKIFLLVYALILPRRCFECELQNVFVRTNESFLQMRN